LQRRSLKINGYPGRFLKEIDSPTTEYSDTGCTSGVCWLYLTYIFTSFLLHRPFLCT